PVAGRAGPRGRHLARRGELAAAPGLPRPVQEAGSRRQGLQACLIRGSAPGRCFAGLDAPLFAKVDILLQWGPSGVGIGVVRQADRVSREPAVFSQTTEYALRAMACLALAPDELVPTSVLADKTKVPANYLAKVLQQLAGGGLIRGRRGVGRGGPPGR